MKHKAVIVLVIDSVLALVCASLYRDLLWVVSSCRVSPTSLVRKVSITEAEALHTYEGVAFGSGHDEWEALKAGMLPWDELWEFNDLGFLEPGKLAILYCVFGTPVGCIITMQG